jgi:hypothetical protein
MSLYRVTSEKLESVPRTTFAAENLLERKDLQRLLRRDISPIGDDLMVVAEEYGEWEDSNRRIDLLCLSKLAGLVVVEIKRTEDGGHMELQALRYAAMVSSMTLDQVIQVYTKTSDCEQEHARSEVLDFLQLGSEDEAELTGDVRIILVSADFSTEVTTTVLWLNQRELDITCIRLRPHRMGGEILIDATQIIPLPEAADYEVKLRAQEKEKRKVLGFRQEVFRKFWAQLIDRSKTHTQLLANRGTTTDHWLSAGIGRSGFTLNTLLTQNEGQVECYIRLPGGEEKSTAAFNSLLARKTEIEGAFGGILDWQELPGRQGSRICTQLQGGWKSPESEWPEMQDRIINALTRLETALKKPIQELKG